MNQNERKSRLGKVEWFDLTIEEARSVRTFYEKVTGWTSSTVSMGDYEDYCMADASGNVVAGICHAKGPNAHIPPRWMLYINVDDLDASLRTVVAEGGRVLGEVRSMGSSGRYCHIVDPSGAECALFEPGSQE